MIAAFHHWWMPGPFRGPRVALARIHQCNLTVPTSLLEPFFSSLSRSSLNTHPAPTPGWRQQRSPRKTGVLSSSSSSSSPSPSSSASLSQTTNQHHLTSPSPRQRKLNTRHPSTKTRSQTTTLTEKPTTTRTHNPSKPSGSPFPPSAVPIP